MTLQHSRGTMIPIKAYPILVGGLVVCPAIVAGIVTLLLLPDGPPIEGWRDALGYIVNAAFALLVWGIAIRSFLRVRAGTVEAPNKLVLIVAKIQPILWLAGIVLGVVGAISITASYNENHDTLMSRYCDDVIAEDHPRRARCLEVADACDTEAESGPCGKIESPAQAAACDDAFEVARRQLTEEEQALMPDVSGDFEKGMRAVCILERTR